MAWQPHTFSVLIQIEADTREQARQVLEDELWESYGRHFSIQDGDTEDTDD